LDPINRLLDADGSEAFWTVGPGPVPLQASATGREGDAEQPASGPGERLHPARIPDFGLMVSTPRPEATSSSSKDGLFDHDHLIDYLVPGEAKLSSIIEDTCGSCSFDLVAAYKAGSIEARHLLSEPFGYMCMAKANVGILASYKYMYVLRRQRENQLSVSWGGGAGRGFAMADKLIVSAACFLLVERTR